MTPATHSTSPAAAPTAPAAASIRALAWILVAAILCSAALAGGVLAQVTWTNPPGSPDVFTALIKGAAAVLVGAFAGLGLFGMTAGRTPASAPLGLLAGSMVRMLVALSVALVLFFTGGFDKPTGTSFWVVFLACGLATIVAETAWGMKNLARFTVQPSQNSPDSTLPPATAPAETH